MKHKIKMTYHKYDTMLEKFDEIPIHAKPIYPSEWELEHYVKPNLEKYMLYLIWLLEQDVEIDESQKNIQNEIRKLVYDNLFLYEGGERV